ncbi:MAG: phage protein Gp36 family protein [Terriglobales bacterium]
MTIAANTYCAIADIQDILSSVGVTLRTDDAPPSSYGNAIAKAANQIDKFLYRTYNPTDLAQSDLVKDWAAIIACYYLCTRRGNPVPPGIVVLYEGAVADLQEIKLGQNDIPGIPRRKAYAPGLSVMVATQRPFPRAVVEKSRSTTLGGTAENYRVMTSVYDAFGWNSSAFLLWSY